MRILILEDNADRVAVMRADLHERFPQYPVEVFPSASDMIQRMSAAGLYDVILIALDHDLELLTSTSGALTDPGTGDDVAQWLATQPAVCPIIVHTTNTHAGDVMVDRLVGSGWIVRRIVPYDGERWISEQWFPTARRLIVTLGDRMDMAQTGVQILLAAVQSTASSRRPTRRRIVSELIRAGTAHVQQAAQRGGVAIEFLYLSADRLWKPEPGSTGVLSSDFLNPSAIAFEELSADAGLGPRPVAGLSSSEEFVQRLTQQGIEELQVELVAPAGRGHALLAVSSSQTGALVNNLAAQRAIAALKSLIQLALSLSSADFAEAASDESELTGQSHQK